MEHGQPSASENASVLPDVWRDFVWEEYLNKDGRIEDVIESLRQQGVQVTIAQLRTKFRHWGFHKSLHREGWQYVGYQVEKRKSEGKESIVFLSGMRQSQERVKHQTNRHKSVVLASKWIQPSNQEPNPPKEDIPLEIFTPRATSPIANSAYKWSDKQPWLQFNQYIWPELTMCLRLLPKSETKGAITAYISQPPSRAKRRRLGSSLVAWFAFERLAQRGMEIIIGSNELIGNLLLNKSIDRIAHHLDNMIPAAPDDNVRRAITLCNGDRRDVQREVVKILLYLVSNRLVMDSTGPYETKYYDEAHAFVDICRFSGLAEPHMLARLVEISHHSFTMTAVLDQLYKAAIQTECPDIILNLLDKDDRISLDRPAGLIWWKVPGEGYTVVTHVSALGFALFKGSLEFASLMIQAGANVNIRGERGLSPLMLATLTSDYDMSIQLVRLLLRNGASTNKDNIQMALYLAILGGGIQLIDILYAAGADLTRTFCISKLPRILSVHPLFYNLSLTGCSCLSLATFFPDNPTLGNRGLSEDDKQRISLDLVKHILSLAGPGFDRDGKLKSDAMIYASIRGYTRVIQFLFRNGGQINSTNGILCPVYAAVEWAQVEACQLLLDLGGSAHAEYRSLHDHRLRQLSPLHLAVRRSSTELVELLVRSGVDVNFQYACDVGGGRSPPIGFGFRFQTGKSCMGPISPLSLAIRRKDWRLALLLADLGATFTNDDLLQVASAGQSRLLSRLLTLNLYQGDVIPDYQGMLTTFIRDGHDFIAMQFLISGLVPEPQSLLLALKYRCHRTAIKILELGAEISGPKPTDTSQAADEVRLRYLIETQFSCAFIDERSLDGRTFLENAILSGNRMVMRFALSNGSFAYDSGALCAAVLITSRSYTADMDDIVGEILWRRDSAIKDGYPIDNILENTAVSIAAFYNRGDILTRLQNQNMSETGVSVLPDLPFWDRQGNSNGYHPPEGRDIEADSTSPSETSEDDASVDLSIIARAYYNILPPALGEWVGWHDPRRQLASPLLLAIKSHNEPTIEILLDAGYKADNLALRAAISENLPLYLARKLIEGCEDIDSITTFSMVNPTPALHLAALLGDLELVKIIFEAGADPNFGPWYARESILCELIDCTQFDVINALLQRGMNVNDTPRIRKWKITALQAAASRGHIGILRQLIKYGANPYIPRAIMNGNTAIEVAAYCGRLDTVQFLLDCGARTTGCERFQYIYAVVLAKESGYHAIVDLLQSHRQWMDDDWAILHEIEQITETHRSARLFHYSELTEEDVAQLAAYTKSWDKNGAPFIRDDQVVIMGVPTNHRINALGGNWVEVKPDQCVTNSSATVVDSTNGNEAAVSVTSKPNQGNSLINLMYKPEPLESFGESHYVSDIGIDFPTTEGENATARSSPPNHRGEGEENDRRPQVGGTPIGEDEVTNDFGNQSESGILGAIDDITGFEARPETNLEVPEGGRRDIRLGPAIDTDAGEEELERRQRILSDLLGEREMSPQPIEWAL
ncbi:ankyrin [Hypomontagnella monticulosa]|nr:ankyrin [Hypomontagnella monticulosa]